MFEPPQRILVAAATLNTLPMDWRGNRERIISALGEARAQGAAFVVFPELSLSGYGCEDVFHSPAHSRAALESLRALLPETKGLAVVVGLPWRLEEGLYNTVAFLVDGKLVGVYAKQHLAGDGVHYEPRWFRPWAQGRVVEVSPFGEAVPFGEVVFDLGGVRIGAEICEDAWVLERPAFRYARVGNDITVCPTASHFAFGKSEVRKRIAQEGSRSCACAYLLANLVGNESGRMIFDGQRLIFGGGELLAESERFTFREQAITTATLNLEVLRAHRQRIFSLYSPDSSIRIHPVPFAWPKAQTGGVAHPLPRLLCKEEEFTKAESLALFDYLRKSRSRGFVVSLSGGADSAACSVLAAHALQLAKHELGEEGVAKKLPGLALDWSRFSVGLLDTVYQGTANSGPVTRHAARSLAEALQATHSEWDVEAFVALCRSNVEAHLGRPLNWQQDDLTLQNIQSRVRAPGVWMLANARGALLLATGNRSECAVGYATMDGDTAGSISPLAG
ncbi:MAG: nitrilase-related carbon-nitrogen hydrolase, partial [Candidatus Sumerlaeia bacterium]|nr:nitrilase-related carbon-nitrogen hydrolase [Candidatus Sumerlaeia bacterium]